MNEIIHTETVGKFDITLSWEYEHIHPSQLFDGLVDDIEDICTKIDNGHYLWFIAIVKCYKNGIELASDSLGGNLYEYSKIKDFINDGYYQDMKNTVINEAQETINKLISEETNNE